MKRLWLWWLIGALLFGFSIFLTWHFQHTRISYYIELVCVVIIYLCSWVAFVTLSDKPFDSHVVEG